MPKKISLVLLVVLLGAVAVRAQENTPSLEVTLERLRDYLTSYHDAYAAIVSDERYRQRDGPADRVLDSEFAMVRVAGEDRWLGFRDVQRVDGKDVTRRPGRLAAILANPSAGALDIAARIAAESAQYNIGPSRRTINNPAVALLVLDPSNHPRFQFQMRGDARIEGVRAREIGFTEESRPTIVRTSDGLHDQPIDGRAWVDPASGTLLRVLLRVKVYGQPRKEQRPARPPTTLGRDHQPVPVRVDAEERLTLELNFARDPAVDLWVPVRMRERHQVGARTLQSGEAAYTNFRRFAVQSRIVVPEP